MKTIEKIENVTVFNCGGRICFEVPQNFSGEDLKAFKKRNQLRILEIKKMIKKHNENN